ncbi:MAG: restriction endonuclease [Polyangiaceae bacterium]|nr:restriction endonuclease [Polyangiaceae bacterium]
MTFTEAAAQVLRLVGKPLHYKEITDVAIEKDMLSHVGKSPEVTMGARLAALVKKGDPSNPLVRVKPGVFGLGEWDDKKVKAGLSNNTSALDIIKKGEAAEAKAAKAKAAEAPKEAAAPEAEEAEAESAEDEASADAADASGEDAAPSDAKLTDVERTRAELAASAADIFEAEDDDDEPIFGSASEDSDEERTDGDGRRPRRRRRRRGGRGSESNGSGNGNGGGGGDDDGLPSYTVSDANLDDGDEQPAEEGSEEPRPRARRSRGRGDRGDRGDRGEGRSERGEGRSERGEGRARGRDRSVNTNVNVNLENADGASLADGLVELLEGSDKQTPMQLRSLVEAARRSKLGSDSQHAQALVSSAILSDNLRRSNQNLRPRFAYSGGRVALTEWSMDRDLAKLDRELEALTAKYREASRRILQKRLQDLPHRAGTELFLLILEQMGITDVEPVRRQGTHPQELHFSGVSTLGGGELKLAIVARRDGRDIGRERVTDVRGSMHHYGPATAAVLLTTGQILSGAKEEAASATAAPVSLIDGAALAKTCEERGIGVTMTSLRVPLVDAEFFEALRGS